MIELPGRLIVQVHSAFEAYAPLVMTPEGSADRAPPEHGAPLNPPLEAPPVGVGGSVAGKGTAAGAGGGNVTGTGVGKNVLGGSVAGKGTASAVGSWLGAAVGCAVVAAGAPVADGGEPAGGPAGKAALVEVL